MQKIKPTDSGFWLLTQGSHLHLIDGKLPYGYAKEFQLEGLQAMVIGELEHQPLWLVAEEPNSRRAYFSLRDLLYLPERTFNLLSRGIELNYFFNTHQFCGKCGHKTGLAQDEWAVECEQCHFRTYPVICPSIIVAVRRGKEILLACHQRHKESLMYTTLAGFVEVGETFEQAVAREIFEETSIKVKNIRYVASQPWAFPNSQMVGFLADYAEGEINIQPTEIYDARWFSVEETLPNLPPQGTIARKLIEQTLLLCQQE
ncbi:NAD+ diphosphatase [Volucribacter psittacicida]|uniref:NAD-capped RNA hydrolase NudC n=1 Tax=Volucribacter psittacicida TaxID=203482 RepID=A0A4R1G1F0_9PAST|nr:NAD(+) diphosphatase [Volucribacter psittacicida]TCJ98848.1 NAD+ diphosphatase [Volucribacter psittacicida]